MNKHPLAAVAATLTLTLLLAGCSGVDRSDPVDVATEFVHLVADGDFDGACELASVSAGSDNIPAARSPDLMAECTDLVQGAHDGWAQLGLLDAAGEAEPIDESLLAYEGSDAVLFEGIGQISGEADNLAIPVHQLDDDGNWYADIYYLHRLVPVS